MDVHRVLPSRYVLESTVPTVVVRSGPAVARANAERGRRGGGAVTMLRD